MRNKMKKLFSVLMATAVLGGTFAFAGCGNGAYKGDELDGFVADAAVSSNGGFAVEKGDFVYFINGAEEYTVDNTYGEVVKGALMRVSKADLAAGKVSGDAVKTVVPSLFVAQNFDAGIYIYGEYVYYATPTTDKNLDGVVENSYIDFKRAKLDGSEAPSDYFFRLSNNASKYRFVEVDGVVYCLFEEDGALKSYNVETEETTVLVSGASTFYYDAENAESPYVYYTMDVTFDLDSANSQKADYNQLYRVSAAATATVDAEKASYTVYEGETKIKEYDFNENFLKEKNDEAKKNEQEAVYDLKDYSTYPYVNLGSLVLDGIGKNTPKTTQFNWDTETTPAESDGYKYTVSGYRNGGVYFTRTAVATTQSDGENAKLYYLADASVTASDWNEVSGNKATALETVAPNTVNTASALFLKEGAKHYYFYVANNTLYRAGYDNEAKAVIETVTLQESVSTSTLMKLDTQTKYLYYFLATEGGNGNSLTRIKYDGAKEDYNSLLSNAEAKAEYQPMSLAFVDWNSAWYKPEMIGDLVLYSNAQSFGSTAYNYIYVANFSASAVKASNEAYEKVQDYISEKASGDEELKSAMNYYFRTGETTAFEAVRDEYKESQREAFDTFVALFKEGAPVEDKLALENSFIKQLGKTNDTDADAIAQAWVDSLLKAEEEVEEAGLATWAIVLIVCGSVIVVAAAVLVPLLISIKKKKAAKAEAENTVNAYKRKIDTTDDKSIDVYADDEETATQAPTEEPVEEPTEAPVEAPTEAPVEEPTETPVEEPAETPADEEKGE